jgi:hypothetical protein
MARPGRKRIFSSPEELDERVDAYKDHCAENKEPVTETGLVLFLGFKSRQSLYDYSKRPEYADSIAYARLLVEHEYEKRLHGNNPTGAIFALKNKGWSDRQVLEHSGPEGGPMEIEVIRRIVRPNAD